MKENDVKGKLFDKLWAPWRMKYIEEIDVGDSGGCIFCDKPQETIDKENLIVHRGEKCFVILNKFPYNNGHLLVIPYHHTSDLNDLDPDTMLEMMKTVELVVTAMKRIMRPDGFNVGMNLGRSAGAGIEEHLHMHVVPRWNGDTNFMPVIGGTKVISESLEDSYKRIKKALEG
jgi:ATP adenylyltransferase